MIVKMLKIDLHIHSIHSGHAYGTFYDIVKEAAKKKMKMIAITDHGPSMGGTSGHIHFNLGHRAPKVIGGVRILWGCEANIIDSNGNLDLREELQKKLDILLAGFHRDSAYTDLGKQKNTKAMIKAIKNPNIKVISHPTHQGIEIDFEKVCTEALNNNTLLELNLSYLRQNPHDIDKFKRMVEMVKENKKKLIVNTDSHFLHEIGDDTVLKDNWQKLSLSKDLIINYYPEELEEFLGLKNRSIS